MNRLERLINLVAALLDAERPLSRHELTVLVPGYDDGEDAARRAFERDKEALRSMGIPSAVEPLDPTAPEDGEGYRIPREQYELPDPGLAPDELAALHLAASTVRLEGGAGPEAFWKLGGSPDVDVTTAAAALEGHEHLPLLFGAVSEQRTVRFAYRGSERTVDPYRLAYRNGFWYLAGWDQDRGGERSFRLDRLESPPSAGEPKTFARPRDAGGAARPWQPWEMGEEEPLAARVWVDDEQAGWAEAKVGADAVVERRADGSVVLAMRVTNRDAFRSFVLGFLDHAEVLEPPELRHDMIAWLEGLVA